MIWRASGSFPNTARYEDPLTNAALIANKYGLIDMEMLFAALQEWGLAPSYHDLWIQRDGRIQDMPSGRFYLSGASIGDRMVANLSDIGHAVTIDALMEYRDEERSVYSVRNAVASDPRIVRVSRSNWGLRDWDAPEYESVATAISDRLFQGGGSMHIDEIALRLKEDFSVAENTVRTYCTIAPMFVCDGYSVRLRRIDEPFPYDAGLLADKSGVGVFHLGNHRLALLLEVDADMERGSGRRLSMAAGALLGLQPNDELVFVASTGIEIRVNFPESSLIGPQLGSVRSVLEATGATREELLTLIFDENDMSFSARATDVELHKNGWDLVARLTGIEAESGLDGLAEALKCNRNSVRAILSKRGDTVVRGALPELSTSPDLDESLSNLEEQLSAIQNQE